jgi:hypothetical protein
VEEKAREEHAEGEMLMVLDGVETDLVHSVGNKLNQRRMTCSTACKTSVRASAV